MFFYAVLCHQTTSAAFEQRGSHTTDQDWIHYSTEQSVCLSEVLIMENSLIIHESFHTCNSPWVFKVYS